MPERLPGLTDLRVELVKCSRVLTGEATPAHARQCLAKLMVAFEPNTKLGAEETRLRGAVWLEACGDLNDSLWAEATTEAIRGCKWMPKPSELRELMMAHVILAQRRQWKIQRMLDEHGKPKTPAVRETQEERLRSRIWLGWKHARMGMASDAERELARMEKREPADWANVEVAPPPAPAPKPDMPKPLPSSPGMQIGLKTALAAKHRALDNDAYASKLEWEVADLKVRHGYPLPGIDKEEMRKTLGIELPGGDGA